MRFFMVLALVFSSLLAEAQAKPSAGVVAAPAEQQVSVAPQPVMVPANEPPQPATVTYQGGLLSIHAQNSTLADILQQVQSKTGAEVDVPAGANSQRIYINDGPSPPRQAIAALLKGSGFDYIILGSAQDPQGVQKVVLTPHVALAAQPGFPPAPQQYQPQNNYEQPSASEAPTMQIPQQPQVAQPVAPAQNSGENNMPSNGIRTPEQLLQELQRIQGGQNGQQSPNAQQQNPNLPQRPPQMPPQRVPVNPPH